MQYSFDGEYCEMAGGDMYGMCSVMNVPMYLDPVSPPPMFCYFDDNLADLCLSFKEANTTVGCQLTCSIIHFPLYIGIPS